jgi:hypothetical protein
MNPLEIRRLGRTEMKPTAIGIVLTGPATIKEPEQTLESEQSEISNETLLDFWSVSEIDPSKIPSPQGTSEQ